MNIPSTALPLLTGGALSAIFGIFSVAGLWRSWRSTENVRWWTMTHQRVLYLAILGWSIWKVADAIISTTARTSWYQMGPLSLAGTIGHGTVFTVCYSAYLACWADVHIHGVVKPGDYRRSKAPWVIFYVTTIGTLVCGGMAQTLNLSLFLPPYLTLEVWTTLMCGITVVTTIGLVIGLFRMYPPEKRRAKETSVHMQLITLAFLVMCFLLRARIVWLPSGSTSASMYLQLSRFVFQSSEWLAIGVMLIFTFPRSTTTYQALPGSEVVHVQWKRAKIVTGIASASSLFATAICAGLQMIDLGKPMPGIDQRQRLIFHIIEACGAGLAALATVTSALLFAMAMSKKKAWIRPLALCLVSVAAVAGCFAFAIVMSLVIAVYPFNNVTRTLIGTASVSCVNVVVLFVTCSICYRLSNYVKDSNSIDILVDLLDNDVENYEKPNKELDNKARTIRRFLLASLFLHSLWICIYFTPPTERSLVTSLSWGWVVPLVTVIFVIARLPLALFGYIASLVYRRDTTRLRAFVMTQTTLNVLGLAILGLQTAFWVCHNGSCNSTKNITSTEKISFLITSLLLLLLIYEVIISILYYMWYKKIRQQLTSLILEDINQQADAMFNTNTR